MIHKYQLKNGLNVILVQSHKAPVVSVQMWVRTGSADEGKKEEGISHFIEHLVFKGTEKFKVGEIASRVEGSGGELNAYTSFDQTVFYVTISKNFTDVALDSISQMMGFPLFDPSEVDNEREVVIEEIKRGQDSLGRSASQVLFSKSYRGHPYSIPVIGYDKNVRSWSPKKLKEYFHSRYAPRNMFLVVSGDFEKASMKSEVEKYFGIFSDYKIKTVKRPKVPKMASGKVFVQEAAFEQSIAYIAWQVPDLKHKDMPALDVLSLILGQGDSSRLVQKARIESVLCNSIGSGVFSPNQPGLFMISTNFLPGKLEELLSTTKTVLSELLRSGVTAQEVQKAIINLESEKFYAAETVDGWARQVGSAEFSLKDPKAYEKYTRLISKVTPKDVLRVARKYLGGSPLVTAVTKEDTATLTKIFTKFNKELTKATKEASKAKVKPAVVKKLKIAKSKATNSEGIQVENWNGVRVLLAPIKQTEVISARLVTLGGSRMGDVQAPGATELLGRTLACQTGTRSEAELSAQVDGLASGISAVAGRNSVGISIEGLAGFQKTLAEIFFDVATDSRFTDDLISREKSVMLEQIKAKADNPAQTCIRQFSKMIYGSHPYGQDMLGTPESLAHLTAEGTKKLWDQHLKDKNTTLILSGALDLKFWREQFEKQFAGRLAKGSRFNEKLSLQRLSQPQSHKELAKKEQAHLVCGFQGLTLSDPRRYALELIQSILAGQGGRLFVELRDKNSLAYSVSPIKSEGIEAGYFGAYIGCSPEKADKALQMMRAEFQKLKEALVSSAELERAKRYIIGRHDIDLQRTSAISSAVIYNDIYGLDLNEPFMAAEKYGPITAAQIRQVAQEIFSLPEVVSLVSPSA